MKEYTLVIHEKENHVKLYLLTPLYKSVPEDEHYILFDDHDEARLTEILGAPFSFSRQLCMIFGRKQILLSALRLDLAPA